MPCARSPRKPPTRRNSLRPRLTPRAFAVSTKSAPPANPSCAGNPKPPRPLPWNTPRKRTPSTPWTHPWVLLPEAADSLHVTLLDGNSPRRRPPAILFAIRLTLEPFHEPCHRRVDAKINPSSPRLQPPQIPLCLLAGVTVGLVALPLAMAFAIAS